MFFASAVAPQASIARVDKRSSERKRLDTFIRLPGVSRPLTREPPRWHPRGIMSDGIEPIARAERPIATGATIGHVHLRTADIDRIRDFYVGVLGFDVITELRGIPGWGTTGDALFLSA